jgi:hypothetical protein
VTVSLDGANALSIFLKIILIKNSPYICCSYDIYKSMHLLRQVYPLSIFSSFVRYCLSAYLICLPTFKWYKTTSIFIDICFLSKPAFYPSIYASLLKIKS